LAPLFICATLRISIPGQEEKELYFGDDCAPMAKPLAVERAMELSASMTLVGVVLAVIGLSDITTGTASFGGWSMWALVAGFIIFAFGLYWLAGFLRNVRDFKKLIEEQSKATFIKELDDVEYLAWKLPIRYEEELQEKKKRLGVK
jgi:hypothetical protein